MAKPSPDGVSLENLPKQASDIFLRKIRWQITDKRIIVGHKCIYFFCRVYVLNYVRIDHDHEKL